MEKLFNSVLKKIKPTKKEEKKVFDRVNQILNKINKNIKDAKAILGGSGIKGTWLKDSHDADIFVCFDYNKYKDKSDEISSILEKVLKKEFKKTVRLHGSRDYFQIKEKDFTFEIVPILQINKAIQAKNITDVSPLHANWVNKHKKLRDDMRLTKKFCKSIGVYGAESYIKGFSGYVCEILTIYCGGFLNLVKKAPNWPDKAIIDIEKHHKNALFELNQSKLQSPIIVIDPVQKNRNAAAALSFEKYDLFRQKCRKFLKKPSEKFFVAEEFDIDKIKGEKIILEAKPKQGKRDIVGCKLLKALNIIKKELEDFCVVDYGWNWNTKAIFYFVLKNQILPEKKEHLGPPLNAKFHVKEFKKRYKKTFVKNNRICTYTKREFREPETLIKKIIKNPRIKENVKSIKVI